MVFSTPIFLFYFLALTLLIYYLVPRRLRNPVLLCASLLFYFWGERVYTVIMLLSTAIDYTHGMLVERCKARGNDRGARMAVASSMVFNLGLLFFFKYWDFLAGSLQAVGLGFMPVLNIHLPIGISFYTFQTMSYTIDVYRDDAKVQRSLVNFGTFVTLFPQLIAGPILKYKDLGDQIDQRDCTAEKFASGVQIFMVGMGKKVLLANNVGLLWERYKALPLDQLTVAGAWLGVIAFTFQIYFDFSGYSDMATGLGRMLGFEFAPNFRYPYISRSITEFWRRWHISLSSWFREYLYIPLGGNRCSRARQIRNILTVWLLTGLWHGAAWTFILWGLWFCLLLLGEKFLWGHFLEQLPSPIRWACTMLAVILSWVLFRAADLGQAWAYLGAMFGQTTGLAQDGQAVYYLLQFWPEWILALIAFLPVKQWLQSWLEARGAAGQTLALWAPRVLALGLLVLSYGLLVTGSFNPFIYFQF